MDKKGTTQSPRLEDLPVWFIIAVIREIDRALAEIDRLEEKAGE